MLIYVGIVFSILLGMILHYTYIWSRRNLLIAFIAPTNASHFEQTKCLITPYLLWTLVEYVHYGQFMHAFIPAKVISLYLGIVLLLIGSIASKTLSAKNLLLLLTVSLFTAFTVGEFLMTLTFMDLVPLEIIFDVVLVLTVLTIAVFTIYPPRHSLFRAQ